MTCIEKPSATGPLTTGEMLDDIWSKQMGSLYIRDGLQSIYSVTNNSYDILDLVLAKSGLLKRTLVASPLKFGTAPYKVDLSPHNPLPSRTPY